MNLVSYISYNQQTFSESPCNTVDSAIFSCLSYLDFDAATQLDINQPEGLLLHDVVALVDHERLIQNSWLSNFEQSLDFLQAVQASRRFRDIRLGFYVREDFDSVEKQFAAVSFFLPDNVCYVAFRGTDGSLTGWKEDFNLCFKEIIPSHTAAQRYLSGVASSGFDALIVGGHSKGGNLAEYASLTVDDQVFSRITAVYNHDGPSFLSDPSPRRRSLEFIERYHKTLPSNSIFGMMLEDGSTFEIVSTQAGPIKSHAPLTWLVEGSDFQHEESLSTSALIFDATITDWLTSVDPAETERFINTIYELFSSTEVSTWSEFQDDLLKNALQVFNEGRSLDPDTRRLITGIFKRGAGILKTEALKNIFSLPDSEEEIEKAVPADEEGQATFPPPAPKAS